jgi:hypothetical protein
MDGRKSGNLEIRVQEIRESEYQRTNIRLGRNKSYEAIETKHIFSRGN